MRRIAISMMRDEADIAPYTVAHLQAQDVDEVVVADNRSVDGTGDLLRDLGVTVVDDPEVGYHQAQKMTALASKYAEPGDWVIPFDADEVWTGLDRLDDTFDVAAAAPWVHVPQPCDEPDPNPCTRIRHRQTVTEPQPKVAFRWVPGAQIDMGNHNVFNAGPLRLTVLDVRHFQYRTLEQVTRKVHQGVEAYNATGLHRGFGTHWRELAERTPEQLAEWWADYQNQPVVLDPAPWRR